MMLIKIIVIISDKEYKIYKYNFNPKPTLILNQNLSISSFCELIVVDLGWV